MTRTKFFSLLLIALFCVALSAAYAGLASAAEPNFPDRTIEIIVPAGPGGGSDVMARTLAQELQKIFGVPINVLNIPGANEAIGLQELLRRSSDGYTLMTTTTTHIIEAALGKRPSFDRFEGIALLHQDVYGFHVNGAGKWNTIEDFFADAKANPGKLTVGGQYPLSLDEMAVNKLAGDAGVTLNYIPYDSAGALLSDVLGGHIDAILDEYSVVNESLKANQIKSLLTLNDQRLEDFPDVPTSVEKGWDVTEGLIRGLLIKSDTPAEIKAIWEEAIKKAYNSDTYQKFCADRLLKYKEAYTDAKGYNELMKRQIEEYKEIIANLAK